MNELSEIKKIRVKLGLTQHELSKKAGVSQSLIAKIEAGRIQPNYESVKKIFEVLGSLSEEEELTASQVMIKRIIECRKEDTLTEVISKMRKYNISQLPVYQGENVVGLVSEGAILERLATSKEGLTGLKASDVMEDCPPIINPNTPSSAISGLLRHFPVVLVAEKGKIIGLVTKSDMLNAASKAV